MWLPLLWLGPCLYGYHYFGVAVVQVREGWHKQACVIARRFGEKVVRMHLPNGSSPSVTLSTVWISKARIKSETVKGQLRRLIQPGNKAAHEYDECTVADTQICCDAVANVLSYFADPAGEAQCFHTFFWFFWFF